MAEAGAAIPRAKRHGASVAARSAAPVGGCLKIAARGARSGGAMGAAYRGHEASAAAGGQGKSGYGGSGRREEAGPRTGEGGGGGREKHYADKGGLIERGLYDRQLGIE